MSGTSPHETLAEAVDDIGGTERTGIAFHITAPFGGTTPPPHGHDGCMSRREVEPSDVVEEVWARNAAADMTPDEVMEMVYAELKAMRAERDAHKPAS